MNRQYIHLSTNVDIALQVGSRKTIYPVILIVSARRAFHNGYNFYIGNDVVWLANNIPPDFLGVLGKQVTSAKGLPHCAQ